VRWWLPILGFRMLIIGLTGSIGMGKSTASERFRFHGLPTIDADAEVHKLYTGAAVAPIEAAFPGATVKGAVDRAKLSLALLTDPSGFERLEQIVHPLVLAAEKALLQKASKSGALLAVLEVPLLFETKGHERCDVTVVVSAPEAQQRARVLARPGMTPEKLDAILVRQMPDAEKRVRADFVVDTGGPIADTHKQIDDIVAALKLRVRSEASGETGGAFRRYWS
jgi:dephospho-CoA kinase